MQPKLTCFEKEVSKLLWGHLLELVVTRNDLPCRKKWNLAVADAVGKVESSFTGVFTHGKRWRRCQVDYLTSDKLDDKAPQPVLKGSLKEVQPQFKACHHTRAKLFAVSMGLQLGIAHLSIKALMEWIKCRVGKYRHLLCVGCGVRELPVGHPV